MTLTPEMYASYCARCFTAEQLRKRLIGLPDFYDMEDWRLTEGEWRIATEQALRERLAAEEKQ